MSQLSKGVSDRVRIARAVRRSIAENGEEVAARQGKTLEGTRSGDFARAARAYHHGMSELLGSATAALEGAELELSEERSDDAAPRAARDEESKALRELVVRAREAIRSGFGQEALERVGLEGAMPSDADALVLYAKNAARLLAHGAAGEAPEAAFAADPAAIGALLEARATGLEAALSGVERERREEQSSLRARDEALARWIEIYVGAAGSFAAAARSVGMGEVAERVRPTARRRAGLPEPEDLETASVEAAPEGLSAATAGEEDVPSASE